MAAVEFSRQPYTVTYFKDGERHTIRRRPPPKLHDILPEDKVELNVRKNDDWTEGTYKVKNVSPRQPNVVQIESADGQATFVPYYDLQLREKIAERPGEDPRDLPINNRYLLWP